MSWVPGVRVGHWTDTRALTGCTVILPPAGTTGSVFVAGAAPGTRETDALRPGALVDEVHAVVLTGGSAFGLAAADGVVRWLEERNVGVPTPAARVPIVAAAVVYDLSIGDGSVRPGPAEGYAACEAAREDEGAEGNVGAGTGATVGKSGGDGFRSKGGLGMALVRRDGLLVGAVAVANAMGDVVDDAGAVIAGARGAGGSPWPGTATTIACIVTNAALTKQGCERLARVGAGNLARAIRPVHTMFDGDTVFALSTGGASFSALAVEAAAADAVVDAVRRGVRAAKSVEGAPAGTA